MSRAQAEDRVESVGSRYVNMQVRQNPRVLPGRAATAEATYCGDVG